MKRRDFLHLAVGAAALGSSKPMVAARPQQTGPIGANNRIRSALIGAGGRGNAVARDWQLNPETVFVATCDVDKMRTDNSVNTLTGRQNGARSTATRTTAVSSNGRTSMPC